MKIGYFGFNNGPLGQPEPMAQLLQCAEAAGFESAWTGEHGVVIDPQATAGMASYQNAEDAAASIEGLRRAAIELDQADRFDKLEISITPRGAMDVDRLQRFQELGVARLILLPRPVADAESPLDGVRRFIETTSRELDLN